MIEIEKPRIECEKREETYGKFIIEPLDRGYGTTLGNALRRVLLSSLPGAAVTSMRIDPFQVTTIYSLANTVVGKIILPHVL